MPKTEAARTPLHRAIAEEVRAFCQTNGDTQRAAKYAKYFTEGYDAFGVDHRLPEWTENRQMWARRLHQAGAEALFDLCDVLVRTGKYEEASFAILLTSDLREFHTRGAFVRIAGWFDGGIRNWGHTDVLCSEVLSRFLIDGVVGLPDLESWRASIWKFQRRAVPVMLIKLLDYPVDPKLLLEFVEPLMQDSERVVQQGVGWFLREHWKRNPRMTEALLLKYRDTAPRLIFQYATEKMSAASKSRFRRQRR